MSGRQFCYLTSVLLLLLVALGCVVVGILTDAWGRVEADSTTSQTIRQNWTYSFGIWRKCWDNIPPEIPVNDRIGTGLNCIAIYQNLIQPREHLLTSLDRLILHLSRCFCAFAIVCAAVQLGTMVTIICGVWPGNCDPIKKSRLYLVSSLLLLLATMCGIVSGICFISLRDLDLNTKHIYPTGVTYRYFWSFMLHWIGVGLTLLDSFFLLCMLRGSYEEVQEGSKYYNI